VTLKSIESLTLNGVRKNLFLLLFLGFVNYICAQNLADLNFINDNLDQKISPKTNNDFLTIAKNNKGEVDFVFSGLFLIYKTFLSSQDLNVCNFHPSCSVYAIQSIKSKGLILGGMKAFDRLGRCNGFSPEKYQIDFERRKLSDPVE
jgi:putative component of membrane protein insertase Oxa1/YidC/SpoIIIJ protein YidD